MAYPQLDKISFDDLNKYLIPVQGHGNGLGIPFLDSNHNLDVLKSKLCDGTQDSRADNKLGIPFLCNPSEGLEDKSTNNQFNGDTSNKLDEKMEKLKEKLDSSIFNDNKHENSKSLNSQMRVNRGRCSFGRVRDVGDSGGKPRCPCTKVHRITPKECNITAQGNALG